MPVTETTTSQNRLQPSSLSKDHNNVTSGRNDLSRAFPDFRQDTSSPPGRKIVLDSRLRAQPVIRTIAQPIGDVTLHLPRDVLVCRDVTQDNFGSPATIIATPKERHGMFDFRQV